MSRLGVVGAVLVVGVLAGLPATASAVKDWNRTDDSLTYAVGLHAGKIGGTGLAFIVPANWFVHVQMTGGIWRTEADHRYNLGVELHYLLRQDPKLRLYLVTGVAYYSHDKKREILGGGEDWALDKSTNAGFGVGIERLIGDRIAVKADLDFTYEGDSGDIRPWPQLGLFFYW
jgi:hypothetical protein